MFVTPKTRGSRVLRAVLDKALATSTPVGTPSTTSMDLGLQSLDHDSGYMSHHQESLDGPGEASHLKMGPAPGLVFHNEDALLEKPEPNRKIDDLSRMIESEDYEETRRLFNFVEDYDDSVITASVSTDKSSFSGLIQSPESVEIQKAGEIVFVSKTTPSKKPLSNVTNTTPVKPLTRPDLEASFASNQCDKENVFARPNNALLRTPNKLIKQLNPNFSPDLFEDEQAKIVEPCPIKPEQYVNDEDLRLIKNVQFGLSGVLPPPSVTNLQLTVEEMLVKIDANKGLFWTDSARKFPSKSLLVCGPKLDGVEDDVQGCQGQQWPDILNYRFHGLHFNRSKLSEEFESLCSKFAQRCVGVETQSSCTVFENFASSPQKRQKQRWQVKSPGRRLSHLARRRITFSSANLQANNPVLAAGNRTRQILVDAKKLDLLNRRKSPRKTPKKSPRKSRTPSSSAKKKLALRFRKLTGEFVESTGDLSAKRALFSSPEKMAGPSSMSFDKMAAKRALFTRKSPLKSPFKMGVFEKKRKRSESDEAGPSTSKMPRSVSCQLDLRTECEERVLSRTKSELLLRPQSTQPNELSAVHKKKLQWAVYEALRLHQILPSHPQFKIFASILARVTRRFLPSLAVNAPRPEGGTTDRMFRIARLHVYSVVKGKSVDEIIGEYTKKAKIPKPQGYIKPEDYQENKENGPRPGNSRIDRITKVINFDNR